MIKIKILMKFWHLNKKIFLKVPKCLIRFLNLNLFIAFAKYNFENLS